jgi:hypothetical protein
MLPIAGTELATRATLLPIVAWPARGLAWHRSDVHALLETIMTIRTSSLGASTSLRNASPALVMFGRAGYAAKGAVYIVIGALAARVATGSGGRMTDSGGALQTIGNGPFGTVALALIAAGLLGYMAWRLVAAITDAEGKGDKPTSLAVRAAQAARGLVYGALGMQAISLLRHRGGEGGDAAQDWSARLLELPYGRLLVGAAALGILGYAAYQLYRAASADKVRRHLDLGSASSTQATWIVRLGRFGTAARGVVFAMIGVFLGRAAMQSDSSEAGGFAESMRALAGADHGPYVLAVVAFGLIAYGLYQLATARYRRMRAVG